MPGLNDDFNEEVKQNRGRKRKRNPDNWKRNLMKRRRNEGLNYITRTGKVKSCRLMKNGCGTGCRYKCHHNFSKNDRNMLFQCCWQMGDVNMQRNFISKYALQYTKVSSKSNDTKRQNSVTWTLPKKLADGTSTILKVCKTFFLHTFDITPRFVSTVHLKQSVSGICKEDKRGKHSSRPNTTTQDQVEQVKAHIESFQPVDSHYCRRDSSKQYLPSDLSVKKMYHLYTEICNRQSLPPVQLAIYRKIFKTQYNLSFHKPIKDQCDLCSSFQNSDPIQKKHLESEYENHMKNKNLVNKLKLNDKNNASLSKTVCAACFDLEQILLTPHSFESSLYYKRRLSTFNFTIYDLGKKDGYCYIWNETIAKRGGSEISSCVMSFIEEKCNDGIKDFFYSDNCISQNKNRFYLSMLWYCLQIYPINSIRHRYLEKGYTFNENDSIHASIENKSRNIRIFSTSQWAATVRVARHKNPYKVKEMSLGDFYDFKMLSENFEVNEENERVYWGKIRSLYLAADLWNTFQYQNDHDCQYKKVDLMKRSRKPIDVQTLNLCQLRREHIPVSKEKYTDLIQMCSKNIIPRVHHAMYLLLPHE